MAGYIGTTPVPQATQHRESFTATGGQTSFATVGYTPQFIDVYLNGVKLAPADYTATNGSDVVLASGATASDILEIVAYTPFEVANQTFTGTTTAANLTVTGAFTSQGIDDNANAVAITIDSSENVGIGTSSPAELLNLSAAEPVIRFTDSDDNNYHHLFSSSDDFYISADRNNTGSGNLIFRNGGTSERMRLDASGNLLVGTTTTDTATVTGVTFQPDGQIFAGASNQQVATFSRQDSDGEIVRLRKGSTTVGSIGTYAGDLTIGDDDIGIRFDTGSGLVPWDLGATSTGGSARDAAIDIGAASARFKDLYLSGHISMGGQITGGQFSYTNVATLNDDSVYVLDPVNGIGIVMFNGRNDNYDYIHGIVSYRTSANTYATQMGAGSANVLIGEFSGVPTVSNVSNGYFSVVVSDNGNIYFWNRLGVAISFGITLLGS